MEGGLQEYWNDIGDTGWEAVEFVQEKGVDEGLAQG